MSEQMSSAFSDDRGVIARKRHSNPFLLHMAYLCWRACRNPDAGRLALERFEAGVSGELPGGSGDGTLLVACNDLYYRQFGVSFILSVEKQGEPQELHVHLCQPSDAILLHIGRLSESLRHVRLTWTVDSCPLARDLLHPSVYYTCVRFLLAPRILAATGKPVLCLDIDGIAIRPVWPAFKQEVPPADIVVRERRERRPWRRILANAVGFNTTATGLALADAAGRALVSIITRRPRYHIDQVGLHYVLQAMRRRTKVDVAPMPQSFGDFEFLAESTIWTPKGWKMKTSSLYLDAKSAVDAERPDLAIWSSPP